MRLQRLRRPRAAEVFPALVVSVFSALVALAISGTSSSRLWTFLYGTRRDPHLLWGTARALRSDEWYVNTPLVLAQHADGYPAVNHRLGSGLNMSLVFDVPYWDWSVLFHPQVWGFAFLPLDQAFAFKWWFLSAVLLLAVNAFCLQVLPDRRVFAALVSLGVLWSPFVQWWFTSSTVGCLAWGFSAAALFTSLLRASGRLAIMWRTVLLSYVLVCFALLLYPPFQVPCALVAVAVGLGSLLERLQEGSRRQVLRRVAAAGGAAVAAGLLVVLFLATRSAAVGAIRNTVYPGLRATPAGGFSVVRLLYGALTPSLLSDSAAAHVGDVRLGGNASEASAFLLVGLFLVVVQVWLLRHGRSQAWPTRWLMLVPLVLLAVLLLDLFVSGFDLPGRALGLSLVPHNRAHIGLGMLSTVLVVVTARDLRRTGQRPPWWVVVVTAGVTVGLAAYEVLAVRHIDHVALGGRRRVLAVAVLCTVTVLAFAVGRIEAGAAGLLLFSLFAGAGVNPLYRGTFDARTTDLGRAITRIDRASPGGWVSTAGLVGNAVMVESGVHTYSGTFPYPTPGQWRRLDPSGIHEKVYNRYAQVVFAQGGSGPVLRNPQQDVVVVRLDPCSVFAQQQLRHVLTEAPLVSSCARLHQAVQMPAGTFYLYDVTARSAS